MCSNYAYSLSERINYLMRQHCKSLSIAESCTGGLIAHWLTNVPGASDFLLLSVVAYSAAAKREILEIDGELIGQYGLVSPQTAEAMAKAVRTITGSDYSISTTGNLGPSALEGKETGLIYIGFCDDSGVSVRELRLSGSRLSNKETAAVEALKMLLRDLEGRLGRVFC